jgi:hypothetical protein
MCLVVRVDDKFLPYHTSSIGIELPILKRANKDYFGYVVRKENRMGFGSLFKRTEDIYEIGFEYSAKAKDSDNNYYEAPNDANIKVRDISPLAIGVSKKTCNFDKKYVEIGAGVFHVFKHYKDALEFKHYLEDNRNPYLGVRKYSVYLVKIPRGTYYIHGKSVDIWKGQKPMDSYGAKRVIHLKEIRNEAEN